MLAALVLRVVDLTAKPFHHDESEHAWFAWRLVTGQGLPLRPRLPRARAVLSDRRSLYLLFGAGDFAARLAPALVGTVAVALPFFLRRQLGRPRRSRPPSCSASAPSFLYFSRFAREDIYVATV